MYRNLNEVKHTWSAEEKNSLRECADVLSISPQLLEAVILHLQYIQDGLDEYGASARNIDIVSLNVRTSREGWFNTTSSK